jgi:AAA domain, putative AbiEii toxin, Type IV TA system
MGKNKEYEHFLTEAVRESQILLDRKGRSLCFQIEVLEDDGDWLSLIFGPMVHKEIDSVGIRLMDPIRIMNLRRLFLDSEWHGTKFSDLMEEIRVRMMATLSNYNLLYFDIQSRNTHFISQVSIRNFYSIQQAANIKIDGNREVYFVGENGDGKSLLLMGIHLAFNGIDIVEDHRAQVAAAAQDMLRDLPKDALQAIDSNETVYDLGKGYYLNNLYTYGANRAIATSDTPDESGFMSLYSDRCELYHPVKLLTQTDALETKKKAENGSEAGKQLPNWVPLKDLENLFHQLLDEKVTIQTTWEGVKFIEKGSEVKFEHLSDGFKNILIWVSDLIYRLQADQPKLGDLSKFKAVVMVDEIELHLHPTWQNHLVRKLRSFFPLIQFIFTTHSPAIIQGASEDAVIFKVSRDATTGVTSVSEPYYKRDMSHMMYNTLMTSPLFGLESARISPETDNPDTSDSYLDSRVAEAVRAQLKAQKAAGKAFVSPEEIDALIQQVLNEELAD